MKLYPHNSDEVIITWVVSHNFLRTTYHVGNFNHMRSMRSMFYSRQLLTLMNRVRSSLEIVYGKA